MQPPAIRGRRCSGSACQSLESRRLLSTIYVDANAPGPHDGSTWTNAYNRLTVALNHATGRDLIEVANGTYFPTTGTDQTATFQLLDSVTILGGFAGYGATNPDLRNIKSFPTILSGEIGDPNDLGDNSLDVVTGSGTDATAVLDGVTITRGQQGMLNSGGSPTVQDCYFFANVSEGGDNSAGGVQNSNHSNGSFINCQFVDNGGEIGGGAGNDNSAPAFTNCFFQNGSGVGGDMYNSDGAAPMMVDCQFIGDGGGNDGAGAIADSSASPTMINCLFVHNTTYGNGGAITFSGGSGLFVNCTFNGNGYGNALPLEGGAIAAGGGAVVTLRNCILWDDTAANGPEIYQDAMSTVTVSNSDVEGGYPGAGNINVDPKFVTNASHLELGPPGDQRLLSGSPCVDDGDNSEVPAGIVKDLQGAPRFFDVPGVHDPGAIVDMGAYERPNLVLSAGSPNISFVSNLFMTIHFNEPIDPSTLDVNDLELDGPGATSLVTDRFATLSYDAKTQTATWSFYNPLPDGNYNAILPAGAVMDQFDYPAESDATAPFFFLNGDANHDDHVDVTDLGIVATNWQRTGMTFAQGDFNLDGRVDVTDLGILATNWQTSVAAPTPASALSATASATSFSSVRHPGRRALVDDVIA